MVARPPLQCALPFGYGNARSDVLIEELIMSWGNPWALLALILPVLGAIRLRRLMKQQSLQRWPAMQRVAIAGNKIRIAAAEKTPLVIFVMLSIAATIVAIAQPRWGESADESFNDTREVMIALDLSRSMAT